MYGGVMGRMLFVDLSKGEITVQVPEESLYRDYIGGYGIGAKVLYDRLRPGIDPLGPENIIGYLPGPLTGTPAIIGSRYTVVCKSPLTGGWGDANSGGFWGPHLKFAGFDGVFASGISERPVYLFINDGKAELRDASHLWGKDTYETEDILRAEVGKKAEIACVGPSGENLCRFACVVNQKGRAAGRSGVGAVMGSKRLKAIVVLGDQKVPLAYPEKAAALRRKYLRTLKGENFREYGTCGITADSAESGDSPVKNWGGVGRTDFPNAKAISDDAVIARQDRKYACWHCPLGCGGHMKPIESGPFATVADTHKPEYETLCATGTLCLIDNLDAIIRANDIMNRAGMDTISGPAVVAFAIECYENGILTKKDTDGIELTWGNALAMVAMLEKIAKREGLGDVLAEGMKIAAEKIGKGAERYAIHIDGQEMPMHDPKLTPLWGLTYQIDATPGRHTQGGSYTLGQSLEWKRNWGMENYVEDDKYVYSGKGQIARRLASNIHFMNSAGLCLFGWVANDVRSVPDFMTAVTGVKYTMDDCLKTGERIGTLRHLFNLREGKNPLHYRVPGRILGKPPLGAGPVGQVNLDQDTMMRDFLAAHQWDPVTTVPSTAKLKELGLEFALKDMATKAR